MRIERIHRQILEQLARGAAGDHELAKATQKGLLAVRAALDQLVIGDHIVASRNAGGGAMYSLINAPAHGQDQAAAPNSETPNRQPRRSADEIDHAVIQALRAGPRRQTELLADTGSWPQAIKVSLTRLIRERRIAKGKDHRFYLVGEEAGMQVQDPYETKIARKKPRSADDLEVIVLHALAGGPMTRQEIIEHGDIEESVIYRLLKRLQTQRRIARGPDTRWRLLAPGEAAANENRNSAINATAAPKTSERITVMMTVALPPVPESLDLEGGGKVPLWAAGELELRSLGEAWTRRLIQRAAEQQQAARAA